MAQGVMLPRHQGRAKLSRSASGSRCVAALTSEEAARHATHLEHERWRVALA